MGKCKISYIYTEDDKVLIVRIGSHVNNDGEQEH